ncbi:hypothetical protein FJT64_004885 [Amphibalanus amphitrite]|uniref:F-box domain-containing protein n=1 Tax=Amphibalanus amphitrite TaxID=1232801 RepID=A0A6A4VNE9_AMPAM|nr:hypothetical protein FJT64_004885 [Amphibalanus amphitrite]KAF0297678.1 hypothetical protein FJT64_004885 [Amphibalanus amphitrite]
MVLTRLSHAGGSCPLGKDKQDDCYECSSEESGPSQPAPSGRAHLFQKPLPPKRAVPFHLLDLPVEVLEKIFSMLTFGEVSRLRISRGPPRPGVDIAGERSVAPLGRHTPRAEPERCCHLR